MKLQVRRKWRPTLGMITFAVVATVMLLPLVGLFFFRFYENQLISQTEAELIAQTTVLAAVYAEDVQNSTAARASAMPAMAPPPAGTVAERFHPILPVLDLTHDDLLGQRPDAVDGVAAPDPAIATIGRHVYAIAMRTQDVTLAGFRILDARGIVIGGYDEMGKSLAGVEEVKAALAGQYAARLRLRMPLSPPPPLYSVSRGTRVRVFAAMPVLVDGRVAGVIYASRTPDNIFHSLYAEWRKVVLVMAIVIMATFLIGLVFARTITGPIHRLIKQTRLLGHGGADAQSLRPIRHHGTREVALLSQSFLDMAERLSQRSDYIRTFAAHVSHELKSPLTAIQGAAELLQDEGMAEAQRQRFLGNIIADTQRLTRLLERLRELALADNPGVAGRTTLGEVVAALCLRFSMLAISLEGDEGLTLPMPLESALIALSHLADNAARHNAAHLIVTARPEAGWLVLDIADDGDGISPANRAKIFEPFFTTRRETGGTGMGLGIVRSLLNAHGGDIQVLETGRGARFEIVLPVV